MKSPIHHPEVGAWVFGGPLADAPSETAWLILALLATLGALVSWISYRNSVIRIGLLPCLLLTAMRAAALVTLLFCLANPVRIERITRQPPPPPTPAAPPRLSVVVDRSDSMTTPDNRGRSRLDDAVATWRRIEKTAQTYFGPTDFHSFGEDLRPAKSLEDAVARTGATGETRLYRSVATVLKKANGERPDALVVLTDGVDTSGDSDALLRDAANAAGVPVYFVPGSNRSARPDPFVRVREWRVPTTALRNSQFSLEATFEAFSRADRTVPFTLWMGTRRILRGNLNLTTGPNLVPQSFSVDVAEPGPVEFSVRLGAADDAPLAARAITQVLSPRANKIRVLIHQSALDWGLRYFSDALRTDSSFQFYTILTPDVGVSLVRATQPGSTLIGRLPDTAAPLAQFDCIVLMRPWPRKITTQQQQALVDFAKAGGAVCLFSPDAEAMAQFSEGPLKALLPVYLEGEMDEKSTPESLANLFSFAGQTERAKTGRLVTFKLTDGGRGSPIFTRAGGKGDGYLLPRFFDYAVAHRPKPGAEVLAIHETAVDASTRRPHILLASQPYGAGRSVLLTTDTLWRWKLDETSDSRAVETFWQQLVLAVGRRREPESLRFTNAPAQVRVGQVITLRLGGVKSDKLPVVLAKAPDGATSPLVVTTASDGDSPWNVAWTPKQAGAWELSAAIEGAYRANLFPSVVAEPTGELARNVPAIDAMRALAAETGGALLTQEAPAAWRPEARREKELEPVTSERQHPKWNNWTMLWMALGLYAAELLLRRLFKLL